MSLSGEVILELLFVTGCGVIGSMIGAWGGRRKRDSQDQIASPSFGFLYGLIVGTILVFAYRVWTL